MYVTQEQVDKIKKMDKEGARVRVIQATVGLSGKMVKRVLLGEVVAGDRDVLPEIPTEKEIVEKVVNTVVETSVRIAEEQGLLPEPEPEPEPEPKAFVLHEDPPLASEPEPAPEVEESEEDTIKRAVDTGALEKLMAAKTVEKAECHIWNGLMMKGEPYITFEKGALPLYKLIYYKEFKSFPIREVSCRMHPRCINPDHLE
jgi:hypothetical protein